MPVSSSVFAVSLTHFSVEYSNKVIVVNCKSLSISIKIEKKMKHVNLKHLAAMLFCSLLDANQPVQECHLFSLAVYLSVKIRTLDSTFWGTLYLRVTIWTFFIV